MRGILVFFLTHTEKTGDPRHHLKLLVSVTPNGPHSQMVHTAKWSTQPNGPHSQMVHTASSLHDKIYIKVQSFVQLFLESECCLKVFVSGVYLWSLFNLFSSAGASLVQWNRVNGNFLASAHDSDIRIWDMRVWKQG